MKIKVIVKGGIVTSVLSDADVDVEVIDMDTDNYEKYEELKNYVQQIFANPDFKEYY